MPADPDRVRLAAEALARARADAWARGERPQGGQGGYGGTGSPPMPGGTPGGRPPGLAENERPRREDPQRLTTALDGLLDVRGWQERAAVGAVFGKWARIVGPQLAAHTRPESFDDGELAVSADSAAWATQLRLLVPQLLSRLAEEVGDGTVRKVRVRGPSGPARRGAGHSYPG